MSRDEDDRREALIDRIQARRDATCECDPGHEWPGQCPGRGNCPMATPQITDAYRDGLIQWEQEYDGE